MRQRAAESDVVIVNHHLLCADAAVRQSAFGEVIPACRVRHRRRGAPARRRRDPVLRADRQQLPARRSRPRRGTGARRQAGARCRPRDGAIGAAIARVEDHARTLFGRAPAGAFRRARAPAEATRVRGSRDAARAAGRRRGAPALRDATVDGSRPPSRWPRTCREDVLALGRRAVALRDDLKFLLRARRQRTTCTSSRSAAAASSCRAAPIDVSSIVRDAPARPDARHGPDLRHADGRWVIRLPARRDWASGARSEVRLPSEFDYGRQAILYLPPRMPDPRSPRVRIARRRGR